MKYAIQPILRKIDAFVKDDVLSLSQQDKQDLYRDNADTAFDLIMELYEANKQE